MIDNGWLVALFEKTGDVGPQRNCLKILLKKFETTDLEPFAECFTVSLMSVISTPTPIQTAAVNNMIEFAAKGITMLSDHSSGDGRSGLYIMSNVFRLFHEFGNVDDKFVRWRFCLFVGHLLDYMSDNAALPVELCDVASELLLERLSDKKPEVRAQAALALHRLQTPDNPECEVGKRLVHHMNHDPSVDVRVAIAKKIAMHRNIIEEMLKFSLNDSNATVRKEIFKRFLDYPFSRLSPKQRQILLENGFADLNDSIQTLVKTKLLERWIDDCHGNIVEFLEKVGVENDIVCEKTLYVIFESYFDSQVLDLANQYLDSDSHVIELNQLTIEKIFLWKCICKYLTTEKKIELARNQGLTDDDYYEILLPDLVYFSDYIRNYYFTCNFNDNTEVILMQLLDLARTCVIDDVGAASINKLCYDLILNSETSSKLIKFVVELLKLTFKNEQDMLCYVKDILNEIQIQTIDVIPLINKVGEKEVLEIEFLKKKKLIKEIVKSDSQAQDSDNTRMELLNFNQIEEKMKQISISPEEKLQVDIAVKNLLKSFELIFQVQQFSIVTKKQSLLTDIIQSIVVGYLECPMVNLRMEAIHCLFPYLINNVNAAKSYIADIFRELAKPMINKHLVLKIIFDLFMFYGLQTFSLDTDLDLKVLHEESFTFENIFPFLIQSIDHEINDSSFEIVIVKGLCDLLLFEKIKSIDLFTRLLIIWFKPVSPDTLNLYDCLVKFFTTYMFHMDSSSSTLAKCFVRVLKEIEHFNLIEKLDIEIKEVINTILNLTDGSFFYCKEKAINSHGELAGYILDYLLDETHSYTDLLIDTLYKLKFNFNDELASTLGPKLTRLIKHLKTLNKDRCSKKYLKKIKEKFDPILKKNKVGVKQNNKKKVDDTEMILETQGAASSSHEPSPIENNYELFSQACVDLTCLSSDNEEIKSEPQPSSSQSQKPNAIEDHGDLFTQEHVDVLYVSSDEEDIEGPYTKLNEMKRIYETIKLNLNQQTEAAASSSHEPSPIGNHVKPVSQAYLDLILLSSDSEETIPEPQPSTSVIL